MLQVYSGMQILAATLLAIKYLTMSNSNKENPDYVKNVKRGVIEGHPVHGKKHIRRPYKIVCVLVESEITLGHYANADDAEKALTAYHSKGYANAHILGPDS